MKIIQKILFFLTVAAIASIMTTDFASAQEPKISDGANLLTQEEISALTERAEGIAARYNFSAVVYTILNLDGKTTEAYADDAFDSGGYGPDGILLLLAMDTRDWYISTAGTGIRYFNDHEIQIIGENMLPALRDGDYYAAFDAFLINVETALSQPIEQRPSVVTPAQQRENDKSSAYFIVFGVALLLALSSVLVMYFSMRTARPQKHAHNYVKPGSFRLNRQQDIFLFTHTSVRAKPQNDDSHSGGGHTSTHTSSSGTTHGGGGGKF